MGKEMDKGNCIRIKYYFMKENLKKEKEMEKENHI